MFQQQLLSVSIATMRKISGLIFKLLLIIISLFPCFSTFGQGMPNVQINVFLQQPVSPYLPQLQQDFLGSNAAAMSNSLTSKLSITIVNKGNTIQRLKLSGSIERLSPSPMSISVDPGYQPAQPLILSANQSKLLNQADLENVFGNFSNNSLIFDQFDWEDIRQNGVNFKLPEGFYRICIRAYDYDMPGAFVEQCVNFQICYRLTAPQFLMPFNTMTQFEPTFEELKPMQQQIQFQWTAPASTCGLPINNIQYDFEIRRVFEGQTIQDATMSIPVYQKKNIYTNLFLFDTLLNQGVLQKDKKYIVRVKANMNVLPNSPIDIENQGYSQILAFTYLPNSLYVPIVQDSTPPEDPPVTEGQENICLEVPAITSAPEYTGDLTNKEIKIGLFTLKVDQATKNNNNSYKGDGTIAWKPFNMNTVLLKVSFDSIRVNSNYFITNGRVLTATAAGMPPKAVDLSGVSNLSSYAGIQASDIQQIENRINNPLNILNQIAGNNPVTFPLGLENQNIAGSTGTVAIMGITFTPKGTSMNILFNLNIPEANNWISLGGTNFCIQPSGFSFSKGLLYLPEDKVVNFKGMNLTFKKTSLLNNQLTDTTSTHLSWNSEGLEKVVIDAYFELLGKDLIPVDESGNKIAGNIIFNANFNFTKWEDWIAKVQLNHDFEIKGVKGFRISAKEGMYYDHSSFKNPPGIFFPKGFKQNGNDTSSSFQGFYMKSLQLNLPRDFATSTQAAFGFHNFIINDLGVSTTIEGQDLLTLQKGSVAGWGLSIDSLHISIINTAPYQDMKMKGRIQMPISKTALLYSCILNVGSNMDSLNYNFTIQPQSEIAMEVWKAKLTFADHSSTFSIIKSGSQTIAEAHMNGGIEMDFKKEIQVKIPILSFEDFFVSSKDGIGISRIILGGSDISKKASLTEWDPEYGNLAGGPNAGGGTTGGTGSTEASGGNISGFGFGINDFEVKSGGAPDQYGLYFDLNLHLGAGGVGIDGLVELGLVGKISTTNPEFVKVDLKKIIVDGDFGPIKVAGELEFLTNDPKFGDGIHGQLETDFIIGKITAEAYFGEINSGKPGNYKYFGVGGTLYSSAGIPLFAGLIMNGFGGGYYHNMKITEDLPSSQNLSSLPDKKPGFLSVIPKNGSKIFQAGLILSYVNPDIINMDVTVSFELNSNNGLSNLMLNANGYVFSNPPKNSSPMVKVNVDASLNFDSGTEFHATITTDASLGPIKLHVPIVMHAGGSEGFYYFRIGDPKNRATAILLEYGKEGDALWAYLGANAYLCTGNLLPSFPDLPGNVQSFLYGNKGNQVSGSGNKTSSNNSVLDLIKSYPGQGFMFGASVTAGAGLDFAIFYASVSGTVGFDMALMQFKNKDAFKNCDGVKNGKVGLDGWYAIGQLYAYFDMKVGVHLGLGDVDLVGIQLGAVLRGGGPNPTWAQGKVRVKASIIGFSVDETVDFEVGSTCYPEYNPLEGVNLIANVCTDKISIYESPWVTYNVPVHHPQYINYSMPPNKEHPNNNWVRTIYFKDSLMHFNRLKNGKTAEVLKNFVLQQKGNDNLMTKYKHKDAWYGNGEFEIGVRCIAYEIINNKKVILLKQDSIFRFKTGPSATEIKDEIIANIYPMPGQQYLLKDEFGGRGIVKLTRWPSAKNDDKMNLLSSDYDKIIHFIPYNGGEPITSPFIADYNSNSFKFQIPGSLKNKKGYKMVFLTSPKNAEELYAAQQDSIKVYLKDLIKTKSGSYSVSTVASNTPSSQAGSYIPGRTGYGSIMNQPGSSGQTGNLNTNISSGFQLNTNISSSSLNTYASNSAMNNQFNHNYTGALNNNVANLPSSPLQKPSLDNPDDISFQIKRNRTYVAATAKYGHAIYELSFRTSQFNNLNEKLNTYGPVQTKKGDFLYIFKDVAVDFSLANGAESFDVFEIKGYTRSVTGGTIVIPPLFQIKIPYDFVLNNSTGTFTNTTGNDGWAMENIYNKSNYFNKSSQIAQFQFGNGFAFPVRTWNSAPSENDQRLYARTNWKYMQKYIPPPAVAVNQTGAQSVNQNQGFGSINPQSLMQQNLSFSFNSPFNNLTIVGSEIKFSWIRDWVFQVDNQLIVSGMKAYNNKRTIIQNKINQWKKTHKPGDYYNNVFYNLDLLTYKLQFVNDDRMLSTSLLGGRMKIEWSALVMNETDNYAKYADIQALIIKMLSVAALNSNFKHFDKVQNRNLIFKYATPYLGDGSTVTKKFSFKR